MYRFDPRLVNWKAKCTWLSILLNAGALFYVCVRANAHPVDIHLPTSYDYMFETEVERSKANEDAENTLNDPSSSEQEKNNAIDQLYGPNGNRA